MFNDIKNAIKEALRAWKRARRVRQRRNSIVTPFD